MHGTGGDEYSLYDLAKMIDENYSLLGIKGNYQEGVSRYFKPLNFDRTFDINDLNKRTFEIIEFLNEKSKEYNFELEDVVILGYSNGANIGINILMNEKRIKKAILLHPMFTNDIELTKNDELKILATVGENDLIVSRDESDKTLNLLRNISNNVDVIYTNNHSIEYKEIIGAREFLKNS